jgi:hypothetical protein
MARLLAVASLAPLPFMLSRLDESGIMAPVLALPFWGALFGFLFRGMRGGLAGFVWACVFGCLFVIGAICLMLLKIAALYYGFP